MAPNEEPKALSPRSTTHHRLLAGERALRRVRCRVSGTLTFVGTLCGLFSHVGYLRLDRHLMPQPLHLAGFAWLVKYLAIVCLALVPLPGDVLVTRMALVAIAMDVFPGLVMNFYRLPMKYQQAKASELEPWITTPMYWWGKLGCQLCFVVIGVVFLVGLCLVPFQRQAAKMQADMWRLIGLVSSLVFLLSTAVIVVEARGAHQVSPAAWGVAASVVGFWVAWRPDFRQNIHARLAKLYEQHGATAAAASIAGLMSGCSAKEALSQASSRFRCVLAKDLTVEDFSNSPARATTPPALERTQLAKLGECDAFLSHSWHDSPEARCAALQLWRADFLEEHGREPVVWFDKLCIDQNDIEADLRGLPIFLSGCKELLILNGPTYLSRLWCIMELFTFVHMGGDIHRIHLAQVLRRGSKQQDATAIKQAREQFDARQCDCLVSKDKERMLTIVMAAFGDVSGFNHAVTNIMTEAGLRDMPEFDFGSCSP